MTARQMQLSENSKPTLGYGNFQNRKTEELIFALVEPVGGGAKNVAHELQSILEDDPYRYVINNIELSRIIEESRSTDFEEPNFDIFKSKSITVSDRAKRIYTLQEQGNQLRKRHGVNYLAKQAIRKISQYRHNNNGFEQADEASVLMAKPLRVAHIIRSLKHDAELELLKSVYGNMLILIAVSGTYEQHLKNYMTTSSTHNNEKSARTELDILTEIDQFDGKDFGQRVRKVFYRANIFLKNDDTSDNAVPMKSELKRFIELLFGLDIYTPRHDERMMYEAFSASMMSTCLSRQVGASISSKDRELLSTGWNDVPRYGGGLASDTDEIEKKALCKYKEYCNSNKSIKKLIRELYQKLSQDNLIVKKSSEANFEKSILSSSVASLIEFSRSIHAEMEAILSVSRNGKHGLRDSNIYVTTYPCENCVKHILAAGISNVFFIEPYPKSRAKDFFPEFINDNNKFEPNKLNFIQFTGIAPISFALLYTAGERKDREGKRLKSEGNPMPKSNVYLDSFALYEAQIAKEVSENDE